MDVQPVTSLTQVDPFASRALEAAAQHHVPSVVPPSDLEGSVAHVLVDTRASGRGIALPLSVLPLSAAWGNYILILIYITYLSLPYAQLFLVPLFHMTT